MMKKMKGKQIRMINVIIRNLKLYGRVVKAQKIRTKYRKSGVHNMN